MPEQSIAVSVSYGSTKHSITLTGQNGHEPILKDLSEAVTRVTGVPAPLQTIIFKGKSLKDTEESLSSFGIKQGCKLMVVGKRNSPEEEAELKRLTAIERSVGQTARELEIANGELAGLGKGFLATGFQSEALAKLGHRVKVAAEQFMRILEQIDSMNVPEHFSDCRTIKKGLVRRVQEFLAQCDKMEAGISEHLIQSGDPALAE